MVVKLEQPVNAEPPIFVTLLGISIVESDEQFWKAEPPILIILFGISIEESDEQS